MILDVEGKVTTRVSYCDIVRSHPGLLSNPCNWAMHGCEKLAREYGHPIEKYIADDINTMEKVIGVRYVGQEEW